MQKIFLTLAVLVIASLTTRADLAPSRPPTPAEAFSSTRTAPGFLPLLVTVNMGPAINFQIFGGTYKLWTDDFESPGDTGRRFAPGSLLQAKISVFDMASGTPSAIPGGQLTSSYGDWSATTYPLQLADGFYIQAFNCGAQNLYIKKVEQNILPDGTPEIGSQTVIFYWPGQSYPEYGAPCSASTYGNTIFYFNKGSGSSPAGLPAVTSKTVYSAPAFPTTYATTTAVAGRYIPNGYFVNSVTGAYVPLTTCRTTPASCPVHTVVGGSNVYHTIVLYTQGLGDAIGSGFASHSKLQLKRLSDGVIGTPTRTYFGALSPFAEQHNLSTQGIGPGEFSLVWSCSQLIGCTPNSQALWRSNVGYVRIGPSN